MGTKFSKEKELEIIRLYIEEGLTQKEIGNMFNTWNTSIRRVLERYNIPLIGVSERKSEVKTNPFQDLSNSQVQYWLGYLAADGNVKPVSKLSNLIRINTNLDPEHLNKYANFLGYGKQVRKDLNKRTGNYEYCVGFCNKEVNIFLHSLGITDNKSNTLEMKIPITAPFLLGYFDGNGFIKKNTLSICTGSINFAQQVYDYLLDTFGTSPKIINSSQSNSYTINYYTNSVIKSVLTYLYNSSPVFLERKYNKFCSIYLE